MKKYNNIFFAKSHGRVFGQGQDKFYFRKKYDSLFACNPLHVGQVQNIYSECLLLLIYSHS